MSFNKVILMGNLTADPELKYTGKGMAIVGISVAVNRKWKDKETGEMQEEVSFIGCDAFGKTAETISQYFTKGKPILLEGRLKQDSWEDKESGQKRHKTKVVIDSFTFLPGGNKDSIETKPQRGPRRPEPVNDIPNDPDSEDVPF